MPGIGHGFQVRGRVLKESRKNGIRVIKKIEILGISVIELCPPEAGCQSCDIQRKHNPWGQEKEPSPTSSA